MLVAFSVEVFKAVLLPSIGKWAEGEGVPGFSIALSASLLISLGSEKDFELIERLDPSATPTTFCNAIPVRQIAGSSHFASPFVLGERYYVWKSPRRMRYSSKDSGTARGLKMVRGGSMVLPKGLVYPFLPCQLRPTSPWAWCRWP